MTEILVDLLARNRNEFDSTSIETVGYDRPGKTLYVEFSHGDEVIYSYPNIEESTFNLFVAAPSLNAFWRQHISGDAKRHEDAYLTYEAPSETDLFVTDSEQFLADLPFIEPSRFGVTWGSPNNQMFGGPFEAQFDALSEADALVQFETQLEATQLALGMAFDHKIVKVTHYFE